MTEPINIADIEPSERHQVSASLAGVQLFLTVDSDGDVDIRATGEDGTAPDLKAIRDLLDVVADALTEEIEGSAT